MMQSRILNLKDRDRWDYFVMEHPHAIAWHLFNWSRLAEKHYGAKFFPLAVEDSENIRGILPLYLVKSFFRKPRMVSIPYVVAGGILADDPGVRKALLDGAMRIGMKHRASGVTLKQYKIRMEGDLITDDKFYNRELNLEGGPKAVWERISEKNRELIDKTKKDNLALEHPTEDLGGFYNFLLKSHHRKGVPCSSERWIRDLLEFGLYSAVVLKRDERIVACTMVKEFKDTVSFPFTCASGDSSSEHLPVYRMYWELIKKYSVSNFRICHSGRIPVTEDVASFRLGWGGIRHPYYYQYYPSTGQVTEFTRKHSWKRDLFSSMWKLLPLPTARVLGPLVVKQFP